ncbi:hypothetical protein [Rhodobacter maris]|uniref:Uncharacterized protein n=1 Tax=Rhodobacter maris TaxID=446682 RepID=A0A285RJ97_9RHOB|nr:hypothetical protein [Rhodobacter maris]SOB94171.1 hypothetical protein SAMN05877831_101344 [Rhodobacter maris]
MGDLVQIALGLVGGLAPPVAPARGKIVALALIGAFTATAYAAAAFALWFALVPLIGPAFAALTLAGLALLSALITWGLLALLDARARARAEAARAAALHSALSEAALTTLPKLIADHPLATVALAAGLAFALTPRSDA